MYPNSQEFEFSWKQMLVCMLNHKLQCLVASVPAWLANNMAKVWWCKLFPHLIFQNDRPHGCMFWKVLQRSDSLWFSKNLAIESAQIIWMNVKSENMMTNRGEKGQEYKYNL